MSMSMSVHVVVENDEALELFHRMRSEGLLGCLYTEILPDDWTDEKALAMLLHPYSALVVVDVDGDAGGFVQIWPHGFHEQTRVGEIGVCAFRAHMRDAVSMFAMAEEFIEQHFHPTALVGYVAVTNGHVLRLLDQCGFHQVLRIPGQSYVARKQKFMDGVMVMRTLGGRSLR